MIGRIILDGGDIVLEDDMTISCQIPEAQRLYQMKFDNYMEYAYSPSRGAPGYEFMHLLSRQLGGRLEMRPPPPLKPGVVY